MQIQLEKPELQRFVREQVECGQYASPTDVVEAALSRMMSPTFRAGELETLLAEGEASLAGGKGRTADEFFAHLRASSPARNGRPA